jgi:uncharacterized membrane protein YcaP (DUF421 family)
MWDSMFALEVSILEKMFRPLVVYLFLIVGLRLAGKRELAQLNAMDLIVLLTLSNTVQNAIIGPDNSVIGGLIGASTLLAINYLVVRFLFSHQKIDQFVEGKATPLIEHGRIRAKRLEEEFITLAELEVAAHKQGFASLDQVESAVLEPSGVISFVGKQPLPSEARHEELTTRLDHLSRQLAEVQATLAARG